MALQGIYLNCWLYFQNKNDCKIKRINPPKMDERTRRRSLTTKPYTNNAKQKISKDQTEKSANTKSARSKSYGDLNFGDSGSVIKGMRSIDFSFYHSNMSSKFLFDFELMLIFQNLKTIIK